MADGVTLDAGSGGATVAADEIGGTHHQRVKVQYGADGAATDVSDTNPMPVDDAGGSLTVDAAELTAIQTAVEAIQTAVELLDNTVSGSELQVDVASIAAGDTNIGNVDVASSALPTGAATSANQGTANTALAAIQSAVETLDNAISGSEMQVDIVGVLPAGNNNIGNVDVASSALPTGAATASNQSTANTALAAIQTALQTLDNIVSGNEAQVDVVAALPAGTNTIGNVRLAPATSGGLDKFRSIDCDENEEAVKASAGQLYGWYLANTSDVDVFVKLFDASTASVSVGTTEADMTLMVPANSAANQAFPLGIDFDSAITVACTTGAADSDSTGPGTGEVIVNLWYA